MRRFAFVLAALGNEALDVERSSITGESVIPISIGNRNLWVSLNLDKQMSEFTFDCSPFVPCMDKADAIIGKKAALSTRIVFGSHQDPIQIPLKLGEGKIDTAGSLALSPKSAIAQNYLIHFTRSNADGMALQLTERNQADDPAGEVGDAWDLVMDLHGYYGVTVSLDLSEDIVIPSEGFVAHLSNLFLPSGSDRFFGDCRSIAKQYLNFFKGLTKIPIAISTVQGDRIDLPCKPGLACLSGTTRQACPTNIILKRSEIHEVRLGIRAILPTHDVELDGKHAVSFIPRTSRIAEKEIKESGLVPRPIFERVPLFQLKNIILTKDKFDIAFAKADSSTELSDTFALVSLHTGKERTELVLRRLASTLKVPPAVFGTLDEARLQISPESIHCWAGRAQMISNRVMVAFTADSVRISFMATETLMRTK